MAEDKDPGADRTGTEAPFREMGTPPAQRPLDPAETPPQPAGSALKPDPKSGRDPATPPGAEGVIRGR